MTVAECLHKVQKEKVDRKVANTLAKVYGPDIPAIVEQIVTLFKSGGFVDGYRFLSLDEIEYAEDDLHVDFKKRNIVPLIDCSDNDFIVYDYYNEKWMMFNIVEKVSFKKKQHLDDLLV